MDIICIGDSFTKGFGVKMKESWISLVNEQNINCINEGINGDTTSGMLARLQSACAAHSAKHILITGCANDFIAGSDLTIPKNNYMAMIHQAYEYKKIPIVGISPGIDPANITSKWNEFTDFARVAELQVEFRQWLMKFCNTFSLFSLDFYEGFEQVRRLHPEKNYFLDGIHLTPEGHREISKIAIDRIKQL